MSTEVIRKYDFTVEIKYIAELWDFCKTHDVNIHWTGREEDNIYRASYDGYMCSDTYLLLKLIVQGIRDVKG